MGAIEASWQAHTDTVFNVTLSADGKLLATAGGDKLVKVWDFTTRKELARLEGHNAQVLSLAFNKEATQLASVGADRQINKFLAGYFRPAIRAFVRSLDTGSPPRLQGELGFRD